MIKTIISVAVFLSLSTTSFAKNWMPDIGDLFHITGCEDGQLLVPVVNLWDKPGGLFDGAKVVGQLSGDGKKCQGAVVRLLEINEVEGRMFLKVQSIVNSNIGWITNSFVGKQFKRSRCRKHFEDPQQIENCLEEQK